MTNEPTPRSDAHASAGAWAYAPDVAHTAGTDRYVLVDLRSPGTPPRVLSGSAALVWESVDGERDTAAVVAAVAATVDLDAETVGPDVRTFLETLHGDGLLVRSSGGTDD